MKVINTSINIGPPIRTSMDGIGDAKPRSVQARVMRKDTIWVFFLIIGIAAVVGGVH